MKIEKLKRNFWLTSEIDCMLDLIKDVQEVQGTTATTHYTFIQIANKMRKRGFSNKSPTQIRRKWFQMKSAYLCFKRGNVERLLLIPERFRAAIAQFVEAECKSGKSLDMGETVKHELKRKVPKTDFVKKAYYTQTFTKFVARMKHTHRIINRDFKSMQEALMMYERKFQIIRDSKLIKFIKSNEL